MVDYLGWRIALPLADVAIGLRHRLVAVSQALVPPAPPRATSGGRRRPPLAAAVLASTSRVCSATPQIPVPNHSQPHPPRTSCRDRPAARCPVRRSKGDVGMRRDNRHAHSTTKYLNGHLDRKS